MLPFTIYPLGDNALTISFGNEMDEAIHQQVLALFYKVKAAAPFVDVVPGYCSLTVYYDVLALHSADMPAFNKASEMLLSFLDGADGPVLAGRHHRVPVCYAAAFAPDLQSLASAKNMGVEEIIRLHTAVTYRVYMIGFLPGFPYLGAVDERIAMPRRSHPRNLVDVGSVGIAGRQTGVYPLASPGGWNIIGRTPLPLFDKEKKEPVLLQPGDSVTFYAITEDEFSHYQRGPT